MPPITIMGILNITPDSFFDGGAFVSVNQAIDHANQLIQEGADILDIGAESSRPGSTPISAQEETDRLMPVLTALKSRFPVPLSIDTYKASVAKLALEAGANMINDISALEDPDMGALVSKFNAGIILMHKQGAPTTMQNNPHYTDVCSEVFHFLSNRIQLAESVGISQIWIDPGIGFGKTLQHNLLLLKDLHCFQSLGYPILVGPSQKRFIGETLGDFNASRTEGTIASCIHAWINGAQIFRVHHVGPVKRALTVTRAIMEAR